MANPIKRYADDLLKMMGPGRVFFDEEILQVYAHDLGNPPKIVDFLVRRRPDAVVLPKNEDQVVQLLRLATAGRIPVTPRGAATSGYGGAVPAKGGIVCDLTALNQEISVDAAKEQVTCDPGVLIWDVERELNRYGLALMTYPTSAPSATIGGHVCQGGVGMGAFQYGPVAGQVLSCRIVLPNGDVKTFSGRELEVVTDCEGITGIVTKLTLKVVKRQDKVPVLATFDNIQALAGTLEEATKRFQPWNVTFHNPTFSQLREEAGGPKTVPRKKYSVLFIFTKPELERVKQTFNDTVTKGGGKFLPDAVAAQEWGEIFNTLRAKALGPSIAPGEVVFPLSKLSKFLQNVEARFEYAPLSIEGTLIQGGFVTILAFALEDERRPAYPLGFSAGIQVLQVGKELGGRAYAPGLYLATEARQVFGNRRYQRIVDFKRVVDRAKIMNPGKIVGIKPRAKALLLGIPPLPAPPGAPLSTVAQILNAKPAVWLMSKLAPRIKYERPEEAPAMMVAINRSIAATQGSWFGKRNEWHVYACSQCGYCRPSAPMTEAVGIEAGAPSGLLWWAKLYLQGRLPLTKKVEDLVAAASESTVKDEVCPSRIPITQLLKDFRAQLEVDAGHKFEVPVTLRERIRQAEARLAEKEKRFKTPVAPPTPPPIPAAGRQPITPKPPAPQAPAAPGPIKPAA